jgi:hypothetical protein
MNLGSGVSIGLFSVSNAPGVALSGFGGNGFVRNFPGSVPTDLISRPYFDSATSPNVAGQMSLGLGGGLSMNVLGGHRDNPTADCTSGREAPSKIAPSRRSARDFPSISVAAER